MCNFHLFDSIPAEAFERFNWAYSRLEMVPSSTGRFVAVEFATPNHADADSMDGSLEWTGAGSGASVFQSEKSLRSWDEGLRGRGVEMEEIGGEQLGDVVGAKDKLGGYQEVEWLGAAVIKEGCECGVVEERNVRHGRTEEEAVPWREGWSGVPDGAMSGERRVVSGAEVEGTLADGTLEREPTTFGAQQLERGDAPGTGERAEAASVVGAEETRKGGFAEGSLEQDGGPLEGTVMVAAPAAKVSTRPEPLVESGLSNVRQGSAMGGEVVEVRKDALRREGLEGIESDAAFVAGWERIRVEGEGALEGVEEALLEEAKLGVREMEVRLGEEMVSGASSGGEELVQNAGGVELEAWLGAGEEAGVLRGGESEPGWVPVQTEEEATSVVEVWEGEEGARDVLGRVNKRGGREVWLREKPELGGSSTRLLSKDVWRRVPPAAQTEPSSQTEDQRGGNVRRKELGRIRGGSEETGGAEGSRGVRGAVRSSLQDADRRKEGWVPKRARLESQASPSESWTPDDVSRVGFEAEAQSAERSGMLSWTDLMAPAASAKSFRGVDDVSRVGFEVEAQLGDKSGMLSWADLMAPAAKAEDASPPKRMLSWAELMQQVGPPVDAAAGRELPASEAADKSVAKRDEELCDGRVVENGVEAVEGGLAGSACTVLEAAPGKAWGDWEESLDGGVAYHEAKGGAVAEAGRESLKEERQNLTVGAAKGSRLGGVDAEARREELAAVEKPHEGTISEEGLRSSTLEAEARTRVGRVGAEGEHRKEAAAAKGALELTIISTQAEGVTGAASKAVRETLGEPEETRLGRSEVQSESDTWKHEETMSSGASPAVRSEGRAGPQPESKQARSVERAANKMMTRGQLVEALGKAGSVHEVARMVEQVKGGLKARDEVPVSLMTLLFSGHFIEKAASRPW